ncbi:MAG: hypothetical protein LBK52_07630 [Deltaproteobacteria bacterium]|jgi:hypothetical protein|nr:hypothetical protein [Deltaproteobacteria bacterium]
MAFFDAEDLKILDQAVHLAGDLVSEEFQLDLANFRQWPVDVRHFPQLFESEIVSDVLAQVLCYRRQTPLQSRRPDFYRVCLYDPSILSAALRESVPLLTLLAYVLTHEFIHVARFIRFLELFSLDRSQRETEERLVHQNTRRLLGGRSLPELDRVMELFVQSRLPLDRLDPLSPEKFPEN